MWQRWGFLEEGKGNQGKQKRVDKNSILLVNQGRAEDSQHPPAKDSIAASRVSEDVLQAKASPRSPGECSDRGAQTGEKQEGATFLSVCWKET